MLGFVSETMFCVETAMPGWNSMAHVVQEGRREGLRGSLSSWDAFLGNCQSVRLPEDEKHTNILLFLFFHLIMSIEHHVKDLLQTMNLISRAAVVVSLQCSLLYTWELFCVRGEHIELTELLRKGINFYPWWIFQWSTTYEQKRKEESKGSLRCTQKDTP